MRQITKNEINLIIKKKNEWTILSRGAESANARVNLNSKLSQLEKCAAIVYKNSNPSGGRIRYYGKEAYSKNFGPTRGACRIMEFNTKTRNTRFWHECYDHSGNVNRVHPKQINGQEVTSPHYPLTKRELGL